MVLVGAINQVIAGKVRGKVVGQGREEVSLRAGRVCRTC